MAMAMATPSNVDRLAINTLGLVSPSPDQEIIVECEQSDRASAKNPFSDSGIKSYRKMRSNQSNMSVHKTPHQICETKERKQRFSKVSNAKDNISEAGSIGFDNISNSVSTAFHQRTRASFPQISKSSFPQSVLQTQDTEARKFST